MGDAHDTKDRDFTAVFHLNHTILGEVALVVEGVYDPEDEEFCALDHKRFPVRIVKENRIEHITDARIGPHLIALGNSYLYLTEAETVTTAVAPQFIDESGHRAIVDVPEFGEIEMTSLGVFDIDEDQYEIFIGSSPSGDHFTVVVEVIGGDPDEFRAVDLEDEGLVDEIIFCYLRHVGLIAPDDEDEEDDEEDEDDVSDLDPVPDSYFEDD